MKLIIVAVLLPAAVVLSALHPAQEDDLVFDDVSESPPGPPLLHEDKPTTNSGGGGNTHHHHKEPKKKHYRVEKLWGVPDASVPVGHVLRMKIPPQAFGGHVHHYEVRGTNGRSLPNWIYWDEAASTLLGVPSKKDVGQHHLTVKAYGKHGDLAKDALTIHVTAERREKFKHKDAKLHCNEGDEQTILTILLDAKFDHLKPLARVEAIENLAGFLGLHESALSLHPAGIKDTATTDTHVILFGPGNVKHRKEKHSSAMQWQVGCNGQLSKHQAQLAQQLKEQARDGTLSEVLQLPVILWRVRTDASSLVRSRRDAGSGDGLGDYGDEYEDYEEYDDEEDPITEQPPFAYGATNSRGKIDPESEHPHRHHHGEVDWKVDEEEIVPPRTDAGETLLTPIFKPSTTTTTTEATIPTTQTTPSTTTTTTTTTTIAPTTIAATTTQATTTVVQASTTQTTTGVEDIETSQSSSSTTVQQQQATVQASSTSLANRVTESRVSSPSSPITTSTVSEVMTRAPSTEETAKEFERINEPIDRLEETSTILPTTTTTTTHSTTSIDPTTTILSVSSSQSPILHTTGDNSLTTPTISSSSERGETDSSVTAAGDSFTTDEQTERSVPVAATSSSIRAAPSTTELTEGTIATAATVPPTTTTQSTTTASPTTVEVTTPSTTTVVTTTPSTTTTTTTTERPTTTTVASTTTTTTTLPTTTTVRYIEPRIINTPPRQDRRLKKLQVTAGKILNFTIPSNTFGDSEDGDTRNLRLSLLWQGSPIKSTHWLQFDSRNQQVYGLPLESEVSVWDYQLVATDSKGLDVSDRLDIHVQQHKLSRTVNHEFVLYLRIDKRGEFPNSVDWELKVIHSLAELYGNHDTSHITVRSVDVQQGIFVWTNDSVPRGIECPKNEINRLTRVLVADDDGNPSARLTEALSPEIRVKRVDYRGIGQCEDSLKPEPPAVSTQVPKINLAPMPRNQVDHVNATVGRLLVYTVPPDTFFDAEDGSARNLKMSLLNAERGRISSHDWLQFDSKNQEFYGIPTSDDIGRKEYQLVVTDHEGLSATDALVVVVHSAPDTRYSIEFQMTLDIPFESLEYSAAQKRNLVEKLQRVFGDRDSSSISLHRIHKGGPGSTVVTWRNVTLPTDYCPNEQVDKLLKVLFEGEKHQRSLTDRVNDIMGPDFPVVQITQTPLGVCLGGSTRVHSADISDSTSKEAPNDSYLITFVLPLIIIVAMLLLAGIIACILYRRRRSGKMSVSEQDEERQSFRSKGIPVIFQDELDEKPDPGNKSPVILKEEKPPLPPPEYPKTEEDGADMPMLPKENSEEPYQPPPPLSHNNRDNSRQNRPKPTPTYRKPPPYVPP